MGIVPKLFEIEFYSINCQLPSSAVNTEQAKKAEAWLLKVALEEDAGAHQVMAIDSKGGKAMYTAGSIAQLGSWLAELFLNTDHNIRERGKEPDNFYISISNDVTGPEPDDTGERVWYPYKGLKPRSADGTTPLAKGDYAPHMSCLITSFENAWISGWDYDLISSDDLLFSIQITRESVGRHQGVIYNPNQDCAYYLDFEVRDISPNIP